MNRSQGNGELILCKRCSSPYDPDDRFCRKCGASLSGANVPAVRPDFQAVVWRPAVPPVVQGAAAIAAGTLAEFILRRVLKRLFRPRSLLPALRKEPVSSILGRNGDDGMQADAEIESEAFMVRRVRVRRPRQTD
ncbi:MAG: zinc ribbon domain-containing protein [Dehalococcoidia bacterium]|jgi:hypothetical protein